MNDGRRSFIRGAAGLAAAIAACTTRPAQAVIRCTAYDARGLQLCEAGIDRNLGAVTAKQEHSQWCWAACISAIFAYHGYPLDQDRIVAATYGRAVNLPAHGRAIARATNRTWRADDGRSFTARCEVLWDTGAFVARPDAAGVAAQELASDFPLIIGALGHAMVLTAMSYVRDARGRGQPTAAIVRDPWPGRGRRPLTEAEWLQTRFLARMRVTAGGGGK